MDLKDSFSIIFTLGECSGYERPDLVLSLLLVLPNHYLQNHKLLSVWTVMQARVFGRGGQWQTQLMQSGCIVILSVLASFSSVYSTPHHMVDASEFICCICIRILLALMHIE